METKIDADDPELQALSKLAKASGNAKFLLDLPEKDTTSTLRKRHFLFYISTDFWFITFRA